MTILGDLRRRIEYLDLPADAIERLGQQAPG
jgi:hypothetical protein